jgi:hypothetical protein
VAWAVVISASLVAGAGLVGDAGVDGDAALAAGAPDGKQVYFNQPGARPSARPRRFAGAGWLHASSTPERWYSADSSLYDVRWSSWGGRTATGEGTLEIIVEDNRSGRFKQRESTTRVAITAYARRGCAGRSVYTHFRLAVAEGESEPEHFDKIHRDRFKCVIRAGTFSAPDRLHTIINHGLACPYNGVLGARETDLYGGCVKFKRWGARRTTGIGYMTVWEDRRSLESHLHGVRVTLRRPVWCRKPYSPMQYTRERVVVYGNGVDPSSSSHYSISRSDWHAVRRDIGRPGVERRVYTLRTPTRKFRCDRPAGR